jgi:hypothetical protein
MRHHPQIRPAETTMKEFWLNNFTSLLGRLPPEEALKEADRALELCNARWSQTDWAKTWIPKHACPIGTEFENDEVDHLRPAPRPLTPLR